MIVPRRADARSPGPSGPEEFSPTRGSCRRATLVTGDIRSNCQRISSSTVSGPVGGGKPSRLGGVGGRTERVRAHMSNARRLASRSGGGHRCRVAHLARRGTGDETAADLPCNAKFATGKGARSGDGIAGAAVPRGVRLEPS